MWLAWLTPVQMFPYFLPIFLNRKNNTIRREPIIPGILLFFYLLNYSGNNFLRPISCTISEYLVWALMEMLVIFCCLIAANLYRISNKANLIEKSFPFSVEWCKEHGNRKYMYKQRMAQWQGRQLQVPTLDSSLVPGPTFIRLKWAWQKHGP